MTDEIFLDDEYRPKEDYSEDPFVKEIGFIARDYAKRLSAMQNILDNIPGSREPPADPNSDQSPPTPMHLFMVPALRNQAAKWVQAEACYRDIESGEKINIASTSILSPKSVEAFRDTYPEWWQDWRGESRPVMFYF